MQSTLFSVLFSTKKDCSAFSPMKICPRSIRFSRSPSPFRMSIDYSTNTPLIAHLQPLEKDSVYSRLPTFLLLSRSSMFLLYPD
jgi:hypothetical protein